MQYKGQDLIKIDLYDVLKLNMEIFIVIGGIEDPIILRPANDGEDLSQYREDNRVIKMLHKMGYLYMKTKI